MKKIFVTGLVGMMILTGCGGNGAESTKAPTDSPTDAATVAPTAAVETPDAEATEAPVRTPRPIATPKTDYSMPEVKWRLAELKYDRGEPVVIGADIRDYGIEPNTGEDVTMRAQAAMLALNVAGGGALFFPEGRYRFDGKLNVPKGVTICGDWTEPTLDGKTVGTVFEVYYGRNGERNDPFITVQPNAEVRGITFWYPEQKADDVKPYAVTVKLLDPSVWGAHSTFVKNCTFINSWIAVRQGPQGNDCPNVYNIYGTPLKLGLDVDGISDVGRFDYIFFSPEYWAESGLPDSPAKGTAGYNDLAKHLRENATGVAFGRVDWSYFTYTEVTGYHVGLHLRSQIDDNSLQPVRGGNYPNGHVFRHTYRDCEIGVLIDGVNYAGEAFTEVTTDADCDYGVWVSRNDEHKPQSGHAQFYACDIDGKFGSLRNNGYGRVVMLGCRLDGPVVATNGNVMFTNCGFASERSFITTDELAQSVILAGCTFDHSLSDSEEIINDNGCAVLISPDVIPLAKVKETPEYKLEPKSPARRALYVVETDNTGNRDVSMDIQIALDKAAAEGGGIVFLPPGEYRLDNWLRVPTGVELSGSVDIGRIPLKLGTIFRVYFGEGDADGAAAVSLNEGAGLRGVVFDYPEQTYDDMQAYPYSVRTLGADCYVINVSFRNSYNGLDMMTNRSDRHYVEYVSGFCLQNTMKIGGGSVGGKVYNYQMNAIIVNNGGESKFGSWENSIDNDEAKATALFKYTQENGVALILGDVTDEFLFNNFSIFGNVGVHFIDEGNGGASGWCAGQGVDYTTKCLVFDGLGDMQFINTQLVSFKQNYTQTDYLTQIMTTENFNGTATFYNVAFWGAAKNTLVLHGGEFNMYNAVVANVPSLLADMGTTNKAHVVNFCTENDGTSILAAEGTDFTADVLFSKGVLHDGGAKGVFHVRKGYAQQ